MDNGIKIPVTPKTCFLVMQWQVEILFYSPVVILINLIFQSVRLLVKCSKVEQMDNFPYQNLPES